MSHRYCQCRKHKHFCFSNIRFRRGSIIKSVYVIMAVVVSISAKYRRRTLSGLELPLMCDASLLFYPLGPPVYVCATLLWGQQGRVNCRVTGYSVCSPGSLSPASPSTEALDKIELLDSWQLAVWQYGWGCDTPGTLSEPPSPELMSP